MSYSVKLKLEEREEVLAELVLVTGLRNRFSFYRNIIISEQVVIVDI